MLGNFVYANPTKLYFGADALNSLNMELSKYGKNVVLVYGGGSIKKNGLYDAVTEILKDNGKNVSEIAGVMPNPTIEKLYEGMEIARNAKVDLILAVGGGSVCDYAKALSVSVNCPEDPWEKYYIKFDEPTCETIPVGCVLTMAGTGDERRCGYHQSQGKAENWSCVCGREDHAPVFNPQPQLHHDPAEVSDVCRYLRHFQSHLRAVFFRHG